jgi:hypothetical protein
MKLFIVVLRKCSIVNKWTEYKKERMLEKAEFKGSNGTKRDCGNPNYFKAVIFLMHYTQTRNDAPVTYRTVAAYPT